MGSASNSSEDLNALLADVGLVVIAGGGNLNDLWPDHVSMRLMLCKAANSRGIDVIITGQGLGPFFVDGVVSDVRQMLEIARVIGVRDSQSYGLCLAWGIPAERIFLGPDDAMWNLSREKDMPSPKLPPAVPERFIVASFSEWHGAFASPEEHLERCVNLIEDVHAVTSLPVLLLPQEGSLNGLDRLRDVAFHDRIEHIVGSTVARSLTVLSTTDCRLLIRHSELVVSSRYHPVVFAMAEGVPAVGVVVDDYTHSKISQALGSQGDFGFTIPLPLFRREDARIAVDILWSARVEVGEILTEAERGTHSLQKGWWDHIADLPSPGEDRELLPGQIGSPRREPSSALSVDSVIPRLRSDSDAMARLAFRVWESRAESERYIRSLQEHFADAQGRLFSAAEYAQSLETEIKKLNSQTPS
jgi:hypothetical protein